MEAIDTRGNKLPNEGRKVVRMRQGVLGEDGFVLQKGSIYPVAPLFADYLIRTNRAVEVSGVVAVQEPAPAPVSEVVADAPGKTDPEPEKPKPKPRTRRPAPRKESTAKPEPKAEKPRRTYTRRRPAGDT